VGQQRSQNLAKTPVLDSFCLFFCSRGRNPGRHTGAVSALPLSRIPPTFLSLHQTLNVPGPTDWKLSTLGLCQGPVQPHCVAWAVSSPTLPDLDHRALQALCCLCFTLPTVFRASLVAGAYLCPSVKCGSPMGSSSPGKGRAVLSPNAQVACGLRMAGLPDPLVP
jgi:hypothetical protein